MLVDFSARLTHWQRTHGRNHLPWIGKSAYEVWLSEVMLQQTQVATVLPYYARFLARFPTVQTLAAAPIDEVTALWAGLGYYSRARNLHHAAQAVVAQFSGVFPSDTAQLQTLKGIGPSTAAAVSSLAYQQRAAIMDGNVKRVIARHAGIVGWPGDAAVLKKLYVAAEQRLSQEASPSEAHRRHTQGLMDLGATVCHTKTPQCAACPVVADCAAFAAQSTSRMPASRPKKVVPQHLRHALVLHTSNAVWLERRPATGLWSGLLSLPEAVNEAALQTLVTGLVTGLGTQTPWQPWVVHRLKHTFTHYQLHWTVWGVAVDEAFSLPAPWQRVAFADLSHVGVPSAVRKVLG